MDHWGRVNPRCRGAHSVRFRAFTRSRARSSSHGCAAPGDVCRAVTIDAFFSGDASEMSKSPKFLNRKYFNILLLTR